MVSRVLKKIMPEYPDLGIEEIEMTKHPLTTLRNGIKMIPALVSVNQKLSGIFLSEKAIREFFEKIRGAGL